MQLLVMPKRRNLIAMMFLVLLIICTPKMELGMSMGAPMDTRTGLPNITVEKAKGIRMNLTQSKNSPNGVRLLWLDPILVATR